MPSITPHGDKYRAQVFVSGRRDSKVFRTKREAAAWASARDVELRAELAKQPEERVTLRSIISRYIEEVSPTKDGEKKEVVRLRAMMNHLPDVPLSECNVDIIQAYRDARLLKVKPNSVLRELGSLSAVFEHARVEWRYNVQNPVRMIRKPKRGEHRKRKMALEEIRVMLKKMGYSPQLRVNTVSGAVAACWLVALRTGMRAGELCDLTWKNVHSLYIHAGVDSTRKTPAADRHVPITPKTRRLLNKVKGFDPELVFGLKSESLDAMFRKYRKRCGLSGFTFHDSRHTAATWLVKYGRLNVLELCKVMGWKDPKEAMVYFQPDPADLVNRMSGRK